jgi:PAS domain S-box-containing protein
MFEGNTLRYVNPALEAMSGYSAAELLAMNFWEVIHPDDRALIRERGLARQRGEVVPWQYEVKLLRKGGDSLLVECCAGVIEIAGRLVVLGTAVDITSRREAEDLLRDNERRWRALIENSSDILIIAELDARLRYVGPSIEHILGFRPEDLVGNDGLQSIHRDDRERVTAAYADMASRPGSRVIAVYRTRHRNGSWRWLESIATNLLDDPPIAGIIINSRDITERVDAELAYRNLVESSVQGLVVIQNGQILFCNRAAAEMSGYSAEELMAFDVERTRSIIHPDDAPTVWQRWQRRAQGDALPPRGEFRLVCKDGAVRWLETYLTQIDYRGRPAVQVAWVDVTERRRAEEDARARQQELAHVLRRRTMGEMTAVLAHEVNQPLAAIVNYAQGCAQRLRNGTDSPESLQAALEQISAQGLRASEIIRQLRGFVRKRGLQPETRQVNDLVDEVMRFVVAEAHGRAVSLQAELAADLPPLQVDAVQIEQVILNLVRNALEAIYETVGPHSQPALLISTRRVGNEIEVAVRDNGPGLQADIAADIFEPFVTSKRDGLGMGLSICRSIIEAHGGRLWGTPNADRGMTFCFTLPLPPAAQRRAGLGG